MFKSWQQVLRDTNYMNDAQVEEYFNKLNEEPLSKITFSNEWEINKE